MPKDSGLEEWLSGGPVAEGREEYSPIHVPEPPEEVGCHCAMQADSGGIGHGWVQTAMGLVALQFGSVGLVGHVAVEDGEENCG